MFGSIFTGLSGMNAFANALRQISNNITNLNSSGFKSSSLNFTGLFGTRTTLNNAGGDGQGVSLSTPRINFAQGELRETDNDLDLAIDGGGFLVLLKDADQVFARTGSFEVKDNGDIVLAGTDYKLTVLDGNGAPKAVSVGGLRSNPPKPTTTVTFADNLSATADTSTTPITISNISVIDKTGAAQTWQAKFVRSTTTTGEWTLTVSDATGGVIGTQTLRFNNETPDPLTERLEFTKDGTVVDFDFSGVTSYSSGNTVTMHVASSDGYALGDMTTITVNDAGELELAYSNGQKHSLGAVSLANFRAPQDLEQQSGSLFRAPPTAGVEYYASSSARVGQVMGRRSEASNVDLSAEFGELILVQRGFQASSQVVSVSNDMIQQLFGIKGQG